MAPAAGTGPGAGLNRGRCCGNGALRRRRGDDSCAGTELRTAAVTLAAASENVGADEAAGATCVGDDGGRHRVSADEGTETVSRGVGAISFTRRVERYAGLYTFIAADAVVLTFRDGGRVVGVQAPVAIGVYPDGDRKITGVVWPRRLA